MYQYCYDISHAALMKLSMITDNWEYTKCLTMIRATLSQLRYLDPFLWEKVNLFLDLEQGSGNL